MKFKKNIVDKFVKKWNRNTKPILATEADIECIENELNIFLPASYVYLSLNYGDVYTPNILDKIVKKGLDIFDVQEFTMLQEIVEETYAHENAGMPKGFLTFADDCMGNKFCFKLGECKTKNSEPSLWFFDHDFIETKQIYNSFNEWLNTYVML